MSDIYDDSARARVERQIDEWLAVMRQHDETIVAIDRGEVDEYRWYLRMRSPPFGSRSVNERCDTRHT